MRLRTLVVYGTDILARGFFSIPGDVATSDGRPTNALFGAVRTLRRALAFKEPDRAIAVLGPPDADWPPELLAQLPALKGVLEAHGVPVVTSCEPADLVASYVTVASRDGEVVIAGSDKRLAQLVTPNVWWYEGHKDVRYTPEAIHKRFGVPPAQAADWLALVGEAGLLPGVKGIGKKGAVDLIATHGSLAAALADPDAVQGRSGKALRISLDEASAQLAFATLKRDLALPVPFEDLAYTRPAPTDLNAVYRQLEFFSLLTAVAASDAYATADTTDAVAALLEDLGDAPVALYPHYDGPSPPRGTLLGLALSARDGHGVYVPVGPALDTLAPWLEDPDRPKVGHQVKAAAVLLSTAGMTLRGVVGDSAIASHLADPSGMAPHDLGPVARAVLQRAVQTEVAGPPSACQLADVAGALWRSFAPDVPAELLAEALALCQTLVRMERAGMPCDAADLAASGADFARIGDELQAEIFALAGRTFTINSTKQLGEVLFVDLGLPVIHKTKTGWSTANAVLERLMGAHPIVPLVSRWRRLRRLQDSWVTALTKAIDPDGRVRSTFHPARSFSARLVNSHPDLGRVPGRTPELARIRRAFAARDGWTLLSVDYQQLGLYVLAHLTEDPALVEPLLTGADMHRATASALLDKAPDDVTVDERQLGKVVNFATFAGQGASALALQLGVSAKEAKALIGKFYERYAVTRAFQDGQLAHAREHGFVVTLAGRRWSIRDLTSNEPRDLAYGERLARRATHEGSVADVTRRGLLRADQALQAAASTAIPLLQVHDEVLFEVPVDELEAAMRLTSEAMAGAFSLRVPLRVACKAGPNWADLTPVSDPR